MASLLVTIGAPALNECNPPEARLNFVAETRTAILKALASDFLL